MPERFQLQTRSSWIYYTIFLVLATVIMVATWLTEATTENLSVIGATFLLGIILFTPLVFLATRPGGNWAVLEPARVRIRRWWLSNLALSYDEIREVKDKSKHNPILAWVASKSTIPFEQHVDLVVPKDSVRNIRRFGREAVFIGSAIHISPVDTEAFVSALRRRLVHEHATEELVD